MSLELPPLLADWLRDATYGVNAILATIPRDGGDALPPSVTICDEVRDAWCARKQIAEEKVLAGQPIVGVFQNGDSTYPFARMQRGINGAGLLEGDAAFVILYMQRESDSAKAAGYARYTLRAVLQSLLLMFDPKSPAVRERNGASLVTPLKFSMSTLLEERGDVLVTGGVLAEFKVRELVQFIT